MRFSAQTIGVLLITMFSSGCIQLAERSALVNDDTGVTDTGDCTAVTWYVDNDGDGFGSDSSMMLACDQPDGYVDNANDCDDKNAELTTDCDDPCDEQDKVTWYEDADGDGHGNADETIDDCDQPDGYVDSDDDCDDDDPNNFPGNTEECDGADNDCDGVIDNDVVDRPYYADNDGDGFGDPNSMVEDCTQPTGYVEDNTDCDDGNGDINPDADEICNGVDDDCDGLIDADDDSLIEGTVYYADDDGDGHGDATDTVTACEEPDGYVTTDDDCDDDDPNNFPGNTEECDGADNDCDGVGETLNTYYADDDGDGHGNPSETTEDCTEPTGYVEIGDDCDDANADKFPGNTEVTCDGVDNDCDAGTKDAPDAVTITVVENPSYPVTALLEFYVEEPVELEGRNRLKQTSVFTSGESTLTLTECDLDQDGDGARDFSELFINARVEGASFPEYPWYAAAFEPGSWDSSFDSGDGWGSDLPALYMDWRVDYHDGAGDTAFVPEARAIDSDGNGVTSSWDESVITGDGVGDQVAAILPL